MKCPRCHHATTDGTAFCPGCGAPLLLGAEPQPRALDAALSLDRRSPLRAPVPAVPLEGEPFDAAVTERLPPPEPPAPDRAEPGLDPDRSRWDLGAVVADAVAEPAFAAAERPALAPAGPAFERGLAARTLEAARDVGPPEPEPEREPAARSRAPRPVARGPWPATREPAPTTPATAAAAAMSPNDVPSRRDRLDDPILPDAEVDAVEVRLRRGSSSRRIVSWLADAAPFAALLVFALRWLQAGEGGASAFGPLGAAASDTAVSIPVAAGVLILFLVYQTLCHALAGATLGKWVAGLRVLGPDGRPPTFGRAALRATMSLGSTALLGLGLLLALFTVSGRALHDLVAGTWVVEPP